jgi:hypothetical protein|tara:strand:- start:900 stop:1091 length:192 start_codon:yes stop_codon:yes gene_type:complete
MDIDKIMILVSMLVLVCVLGIAGATSGEFGLPDMSNDRIIPQINAGTSTDGFYDYCYRMGFDC